jgi:dipeptide transport system ATP-binding protein
MSSVLATENLRKYFHLRHWRNTKTIKAVDDISFQLQQGKTLAIVGETGSGKSSLARLLVGIEKPTSGRVLIEGEDVYQLSSAEQQQKFKKIRMIFQNPSSSLNPHSRIGKTLEEPLKINTDFDSAKRRQIVNETLQKVGLRAEHASRFPHMFSGGQQQRIAIARALILQPKVIVADEPLSALDVSVQAQIINLMMDLQEELQLSYIFISHDLGVVEHIADQVLVMYRGQLMEYGEVDQIFDSPKHPYTRTLLASTPTYRHTVKITFEASNQQLRKQAKNAVSGCVFAARCPYVQQTCLEQQPKTHNLKKQLVTCHWPLE